MKSKNNLKKVTFIFLILDVLLILTHLIFGRRDDFLNLDKEYNLPATYSAIKLFIVGLTSFIVFFLVKKSTYKIWQEVYSWLAFAGLFIYLAFDEFFTLHERAIEITSPNVLRDLNWFSNPVFYWVILFLPLIGIALYLFTYFIRRVLINNSLSRNLFLFGAFSFFLVIAFEFIGGFLSGELSLFVIVLEESAEIFGTTLFLSGVLNYYNYFKENNDRVF